MLVAMYSTFAEKIGLPTDSNAMWSFVFYAAAFGMSMHVSRSLQALLLQREAAMGMAIEWLTLLAALAALLVYRGGISLVDALWIHAGTGAMAFAYMGARLHGHFAAQIDSGSGRVLDSRIVRRMGWYNYLQALAGFHADPPASKLLSAYLLPGPATAAFGLAHAVTGLMRRYLPANLLLGLIEPTVMATYSQNRNFAQTTRHVSTVLKVNLFILVPFAAWVSLAGRPLVELITGGKYGESVWLMGGLLVILMMENHRLILQLIANAIERSELLLHSNLWSLLLVPVTAVAAYIWGLPGLVGGMASIAFSRNLYMISALRKLSYNYTPDWRGIYRILTATTVACGLALPVTSSMLASVIGSIVSGIAVVAIYLVLTYLWKPFSQNERDALNRFFGKKLFVW